MTESNPIESVIEDLRGTCDNLVSVAERHGIDPSDSALCESIDQQIFNCADCGWWCEMCEEVSEFAGLDEWTCSQCARENYAWDGEE